MIGYERLSFMGDWIWAAVIHGWLEMTNQRNRFSSRKGQYSYTYIYNRTIRSIQNVTIKLCLWYISNVKVNTSLFVITVYTNMLLFTLLLGYIALSYNFRLCSQTMNLPYLAIFTLFVMSIVWPHLSSLTYWAKCG